MHTSILHASIDVRVRRTTKRHASLNLVYDSEASTLRQRQPNNI